tara:strand:+ start:4094 stop:4465 length:372 start_codon:yes stop_codon:yes gene_type:complete
MSKNLNIQVTDYILPSWNQIYKGVHWVKRKQLVDEAHELVKWAVYQVQNKPDLPFLKPVDIFYHVHYEAKRRRDPDNATVKFLCDGLVLSGVLTDDSSKEINSITVKVSIGEKNFVDIKIKEL